MCWAVAPGLALLGPVDEKFVQVSDFTEPCNDPAADGCHISKGYDATTHFETTVDDVLDMYTRITGKVMSTVWVALTAMVLRYPVAPLMHYSLCLQTIDLDKEPPKKQED